MKRVAIMGSLTPQFTYAFNIETPLYDTFNLLSGGLFYVTYN